MRLETIIDAVKRLLTSKRFYCHYYEYNGTLSKGAL